jgi:hypothetical protein
MKVYNSIPAELKPPPGASQLHYVDSFDNDFSLLLRERISTTLYDMMNDEIEVKVNMMASLNIKYNPETDMKNFKEKLNPQLPSHWMKIFI